MEEKEQQQQKETPRYVDYKDVAYLKQFTNAHARIHSQRRTRVGSKKQREITQAIKRARFMALMPFIAR